MAGKCRQRGENILGLKKIQPRHRLANLKNGARSDLRELCSSLDVGIYKTGKGQLYRIPNIKRETKGGIHKIPLKPSEVQEASGLSINEIKELARKPRLIDLPAVPKSEVRE